MQHESSPLLLNLNDDPERIVSADHAADQDQGSSIGKPTTIIAPPPLGRTLVRLAASFVASAMVSGILMAFPELSTLLTENGLFAEGCSAVETSAGGQGCASQAAKLADVYFVGGGLSVASMLFVGQVFDSFGARTCAITGGVGTLISLYVLFLALTYRSETLV